MVDQAKNFINVVLIAILLVGVNLPTTNLIFFRSGVRLYTIVPEPFGISMAAEQDLARPSSSWHLSMANFFSLVVQVDLSQLRALTIVSKSK